MKTNKGLVAYAKKALAERWGYVWGTYGLVLTETLLAQKLSQYPNNICAYEDFIRKNWLGKRTADCVGLIKSYLWYDETPNKIIYNGSTDTGANGMYNGAKEKGLINTIPEIPGICVWKKGHIGVYIGNGWVIEARGTKDGVVMTPLNGTGANTWTHWLKCPFIEYIDEKPTLRIGAKGDEVRKLQKALYITVDGSFGAATLKAVKDFQENNGLVNDGVVGPKTWGKLESDTLYFTFPYISMIRTKPQNIEVVLLGDTLHNANVNGINGTFFDTPRPKLPESCWGLAVNNGKPLGPNSHLTDWKGTKRGTVWFDGKELFCERINHYKQAEYMEWGISGVMLVPDYNRWIELYLADIFRKTNHTVIGYDAEGNVIMFTQKNCSMADLINTCKKFGLVAAISLDGGASTQIRFNNKGFVSSRKINSAVIVKG